ncbi:MAG: hypothetical protein NVSMB6_28030 [Burkholderiaceae bacterium]
MLYPNHPRALQRLGFLKLQQGRPNEVAAPVTLSIRLDPLHAEQPNDQTALAAQAIERSLALQPTYIESSELHVNGSTRSANLKRSKRSVLLNVKDATCPALSVGSVLGVFKNFMNAVAAPVSVDDAPTSAANVP